MASAMSQVTRTMLRLQPPRNASAQTVQERTFARCSNRFSALWPRQQQGELALVARVRVGWQSVSRWVVSSLVGGILLCVSGSGEAQHKPKKPQRSRRETNASRQARIQRTINDTYSHKYEVIGGGGYLRWRSGEATKRNNEVGWDAAFNYYLNPKLAIIGDAQGSFGYAHQQLPTLFPQILNPQINEYFFTGGASYRFYAREKAALSAQASAGIADGIFSGGAKGLTGPQVGLWNDGLRPAAKISLSADYNFYPNLAFRVSPTYILSDFSYAPQTAVLNGTSPGYTSTIQSNFGFNAGVVYRFGRQR